MATPKQNLFLPVGGLQSDVDDKLLPLGRVIDLENCFPLRKGAQEGTIEAIKRYGTTPLVGLAPTYLGQLGTHQGALINAGVPLEVLATPTSPEWRAATGDMRPGIGVQRFKLSTQASTPDTVTGNGCNWTILGDGAGLTLTLLATDLATGHRSYSSTMALPGGSATWASWKTVYTGGRATFIGMDNAGKLTFQVVDGTSFIASAPVVTGVVARINGAFHWMDATARPLDSTVMVAFPDATPNVAACDFDPATGTVTAWTPKDSGAASIPLTGGSTLGWIVDGFSTRASLITTSAAQGLRVQWNMPAVGATRQAASTQVMDAAFTGVNGAVAGHTISSSAAGEFLVVYDTGTTRIVRVGARVSGANTNYLLARRCNLRTKTWLYGADSFVVVGTPSATDGTHFVLRVPAAAETPQKATPIARIAVRQAVSGANGLSSVTSPAVGQYVMGLNFTPRFDSGTSGVEIGVLTFPAQPQYTMGVPREAIDSTFVPGASLAQYDGASYLEAGFAYAPEGSVSLVPSAGGGLTASSTYWYVFVFMYSDAQGRVWRSAPSVPVSGATGVGDGTMTIAVQTLRISGRAGSLVTIEAYRGAAGVETLLQKVGTVANSQSVDTISFVDTMSDATLASQEFLYSNGNVLENDAPPGFSSIAEAQNRTWGISTDDPQVLWPSKEHVNGVGLEWSEEIAFDVRDEHGPMRGLSVIDSRPIAFKDDAVYAVGGQGPDALGQGGSYAAQLICKGIGCNNPQTICETRDGVIFRSTSQRAGFFLLDRGLSVTYIGGPVQRYDGETITSAIFVSSLLQARFYTVSGRTLVYDLVTGVWTTFTGQPCYTAVSWAGVATFVSSDSSRVLYEDLTGATLTDDGVATTMLIGWPWLQVNGLRGYERFWRLQLVGEVSAAACPITMYLYRNQETTPLATLRRTTPVGVIDREIRYSTKLGALKAVITDSGSSTSVLKVSGIAVEVTAKAGLQRVAPGDRLR